MPLLDEGWKRSSALIDGSLFNHFPNSVGPLTLTLALTFVQFSKRHCRTRKILVRFNIFTNRKLEHSTLDFRVNRFKSCFLFTNLPTRQRNHLFTERIWKEEIWTAVHNFTKYDWKLYCTIFSCARFVSKLSAFSYQNGRRIHSLPIAEKVGFQLTKEGPHPTGQHFWIHPRLTLPLFASDKMNTDLRYVFSRLFPGDKCTVYVQFHIITQEAYILFWRDKLQLCTVAYLSPGALTPLNGLQNCTPWIRENI